MSPPFVAPPSMAFSPAAPPSTTPSSAAQSSATFLAVDPVDGYCATCEHHHFPDRTPTGLQYPTTCPNQFLPVIPIMFVGTAGVCNGSRIGGHMKYGGGRILEQHRRTALVLMTNEHMTSKVCPLCFALVRLSKARRDVKGESKLVSVHGAVECTNPGCISYAIGYCRRGRDSNACINIALAGYSQLTSRRRETLQPYSRSMRPQGATHSQHQPDIAGTHTSLIASVTGPQDLDANGVLV